MAHRSATGRYEIDMTRGAMLPKVLMFTVPLILTGILQLLYNAADTIVVGRFAGTEALAAVGSTSSMINLLVNLLMGMSVGASVVIARAFGAGDAKQVQRGVQTAITLALAGGVFVGLLGFTFARPLLELMGNPEDVIDMATTYMRIFFLGMPFNMLYNFGSGILRATGDTRRPLLYLSISGMINVVLNLVLVIVFHLGVSGVAIATVISQMVSSILCTLCLMRSEGPTHLELRQLRIYRTELTGMLQIGLPAGLQGSLFSISNVLIQSSVNSFGSVIVAANSAACNLEGFVYTAMNSLHQADQTFASQNFGAGQYSRVRKTLFVCEGVCITIGLSMGLLFYAFGSTLLSFYNTDPEVIRYGLVRCGIIMPTYFTCGMMDTIVGQLRAIGYSVMPMIVSLTGACLMRIVWILTIFQVPQYHTLQVLYASYPISWVLTLSVHIICYLVVVRRLPAKDAPLPAL